MHAYYYTNRNINYIINKQYLRSIKVNNQSLESLNKKM